MGHLCIVFRYEFIAFFEQNLMLIRICTLEILNTFKSYFSVYNNHLNLFVQVKNTQ